VLVNGTSQVCDTRGTRREDVLFVDHWEEFVC
jgi:hypothetical protein